MGLFLDYVLYAKNDRSLGTAFTINPASFERGIYPHVMLLNSNVRCGLRAGVVCRCRLHTIVSTNTTSAISYPLKLPLTSNLPLAARAASSASEVHMLVGLPKVGKTTWAEEHMKNHPEKHFYVLSTDEIMSRYHDIKFSPNKDS